MCFKIIMKTIIFLLSIVCFSINTNLFCQEKIADNSAIVTQTQLDNIQKPQPDIRKITLLFDLAQSYYLQMDFEDQLKTLQEALALSIELNDTEKITEAYLLLAQIKIEDAQTLKLKKESLDKALNLLPNIDNYSLIAKAKDLEIDLNDSLLPPERLKHYQDNFNLKKEKSLSPVEYAKSELYIGEAFFNVSILDSSLIHYNNVLIHLENAPDDIEAALIRGKLYTELGEYYGFKEGAIKEIEKTKDCYIKADSIFTAWNAIPNQVYNTASYSHFLAAIGENSEALTQLTKAYKKSDKYVTASILANFGLLSYNNGNYDESVNFYGKAFERYKVINDPQGVAIAGLSLAVVYSRIKEFDKAIAHLEEIDAYVVDAEDSSLTKAIHTTRGKVFLAMGNYEGSIEERKKAIAIDYQSENYSSIANEKIVISDLYLKLGKLEEAEQFNNEALTYFKDNYEVRALVNLYNNFYNIYKTKGDYKQSLDYLETKITYQDSLDTQELKERLNEERANIKVIEAQESVNRTEKEKELLKREATLLTTRNRLYIISGILVSLLFILLYLNSRYKNKVKRQIAVEKLRTKISADLHDDVGSLLTGLSMQSEILGKNAPEDIKPKLERVSELSRSAMLKMRDAVWVMDARKDNWQSLIDRINEFAAEHLGAKELNYNLKHTNPSNEEEIEGLTRQHLYLIVKEAITNILKHSNADTVAIDLSKNKSEIALSIKDNGMVASQGTAGLGVSNMKQRIEELSGKLDITTTDGYQIAVKIPA